jgi:monomeric sarcosine oxidase
LSLGTAESELVAGVHRAARDHGLIVEALTADELSRRFPQFRLEESIVGVIESAAGFLYVDQCVRALQRDAARAGAELRFHEPVLEWKTSATGVAVRTEWETLAAERLIVAGGAWAGGLLRELGLPLTVMRQTPLWFRPHDASLFRRDRFPIFIAELAGEAFYGIPAIDSRGIKVARHYGAAELPGPEAVDRQVTTDDESPIRAFLRERLPDAAGPCTDGSVCLYTLTPDRHFIIDRHPGNERVAIAAGFSGHGFKFAPVVGEALADLVTEGRTEWPIGRFSARRFTTP